jgi:death-on-curing family protein
VAALGVPDIRLITIDDLQIIHNVLLGFFKDYPEPVPPWEDGDRVLLETYCACTEVYDKYPDIPTKAAKLFYSGIKLHCFPNGNKRFSLVGVLLFLVLNGYRLTAAQGVSVEVATWVADSDPHSDLGNPDRVVGVLAEFFAENIEPRDEPNA